jgi:hypothetical protein
VRVSPGWKFARPSEPGCIPCLGSSQRSAATASPTCQRTIHHASRGSRVLLYRCAEACGYMSEQRKQDGRPGAPTEAFVCLAASDTTKSRNPWPERSSPASARVEPSANRNRSRVGGQQESPRRIRQRINDGRVGDGFRDRPGRARMAPVAAPRSGPAGALAGRDLERRLPIAGCTLKRQPDKKRRPM